MSDASISSIEKERQLRYIEAELSDLKKQHKNTQAWMRKRQAREADVSKEICGERGLQPTFKNYLQERARRNDRHGAHSSLGYIEWLREESKRLFVKRKLIHKEAANDIKIPDTDMEAYGV